MIKKKKYKKKGLQTGVLPVRIILPRTTKSFKFEQQLVPSKHIELKTDYKRTEKGYFKRRHVGGCQIM